MQIGNKRVVIKPTAAERASVTKLQRASVAGGKIAYPLLTVIAAKIANLSLPLVCAVMQRESYEGKNVWGDDQTIFASGGRPEAVTKSQYLKYKEERGPENPEGLAPGKQQGVGPGQLTDAYLQDDADKLGGAWRPLPNMIIAFTHLKDVIAQHPGRLAAGLAAYNGSGEQAQKYAQIVLSNEREWAAALGVPSTRRG